MQNIRIVGLPTNNSDRRRVLSELAADLLKGSKPEKGLPLKYRRRLNKANAKIKGKLAHVERQEARAKPEARPQGVYVIGAESHPVKIGIATDVHARLKGIQTGCPEHLRIYHFAEVEPGAAREIEKRCHHRLAPHRKSGEWFDIDWREAVAVVRSLTT